jgi:alpha,alpha-trehalase
MNSLLNVSRRQYDAVIFDLDGVITRTATVHAAAWKQLFDEFLLTRAQEIGQPFQPFNVRDDYLAYVDGKPRYDGVKSFLQSRGLDLPHGVPDDPPEAQTVCGLGNRKDRLFNARLQEDGVQLFDSTIALVHELREAGFHTAVISSSKNCQQILEVAEVDHLFEERVDGVESERIGIKGKPAPDIFLEAARRLGVPPERAIVVEDAISGVKAGQMGGFGRIVGVDRDNQTEALMENGADVVVKDLIELQVETAVVCEQRIEDLPDGTECLEHVSRTPQTRVAVFLDYDGTLSPIVEDPTAAVISHEMRQAVAKLAEHCIVVIISGRDLEDVQERVGLDHLIYSGSHGFEIAGPEGLHTLSQEAKHFIPMLTQAHQDLKTSLQPIPGAYMERKKFSLAIHTRRVAEDQRAEVEAAVDRMAKKHPKLRKTKGKMVFELQPRIDWNKGKAILWIMEAMKLDPHSTLPIYLGDDVTDEDAFQVLPPQGIGLVVRGGTHPTCADYSLADTEAVRVFLNRLATELSMGSSVDAWAMTYEGFNPKEEKLREALCTLGNGYFATRAATPENSADDIHYPGTYLACGYNRLTTKIAGREVENEDLVNLPNWLPLSFRIEGGDWFDVSRVDLLDCRQTLDLKCGILRREVRFRDSSGRETLLLQRRLVHMKHQHLAALETTVKAINWSGRIEFRSALDGQVINAGVARYRDLNSQHLRPVEQKQVSADTIFLKVETVQSELRIAQAARTRIYPQGSHQETSIPRDNRQEDGYVEQSFALELDQGAEIRIEKVVGLATSRDHAITEAGSEAIERATRAGDFAQLLQSHTLAWAQLWRRFNIELSLADPIVGARTSLILRLHCFHLLQTTSLHTMDLDVGVPSRGWHGEAYRGHIFWDELFIFPFLNLRLPEITRKLLLYRYRRLDEARHAAREAGYRGAMYPWQSGSDGREETQVVHLNPKSGRWVPDNSHLQRHVNAAIAYNIWQYYQATEDTEFYYFSGAEMLLEIARFLADLATPNPETGRYDIIGVMGPDEYHDALPDSDQGGLPNNAYTSVMASWVLSRATETLSLLPEDRRRELCENLSLSEGEIVLWDDISRKLTVPYQEDGIISQFEGYANLKELDWAHYRERHGHVLRLDRVLEAEGDSPNHYKASKQADVLMLFYLFSNPELKQIFAHLGYPFEHDTVAKNIAYYEARTSHGSTLSHVVHSWVVARSDRARAWQLFRQALESDVGDVQGGTTPEGIHLGAMAGTVDLVQRCFTGVQPRGDVLHLDPALPAEIEELSLHIRYRGHSLILEVSAKTLRVRSLRSAERPIRIAHGDQELSLTEGTTLTFPLTDE